MAFWNKFKSKLGSQKKKDKESKDFKAEEISSLAKGKPLEREKKEREKAEKKRLKKSPEDKKEKQIKIQADAVKNEHLDVLYSLIETEKTINLQKKENKYVFRVNPKSNKVQIKKTVKAIFNVNPLKVNIINVRGKIKIFRGERGKRNDWTKAIVQLKSGNRISL